MATLNRLINEMKHELFSGQLPEYMRAFDGTETFTKTDTGYFMEVIVPGFSREDLIVDIVNEQYLIVVGESLSHKKPFKFAQKWLLPMFVDISSIQATAKNGVLTIEMNKKDQIPSKPNVYRVDIR